jgi:hypothetical protein
VRVGEVLRRLLVLPAAGHEQCLRESPAVHAFASVSRSSWPGYAPSVSSYLGLPRLLGAVALGIAASDMIHGEWDHALLMSVVAISLLGVFFAGVGMSAGKWARPHRAFDAAGARRERL